MATYHFKCCLCDKKVSARTKYYKRHLQKYFCVNAKELSNRYICYQCQQERKEKRPSKTQLRLEWYPRFKELKKLISLEAVKLKTLGINNQYAMNNFLETVKTMLDAEGVVHYSYVVDNELKGILMKLPFLGTVLMKVNLNETE